MSLAPPPDRAATPSPPDLQREAIIRVATVMSLHLDGLAARSAGEIWTREREFRDHFERPDQLHESCKVSLGAALSSLAAGHLEPARAEQVRNLGRTASRQSIPLEVALRALRIDYLVLWGEMLLVARTTDARTLQSLINASEPVWAAIDGVMVEFTGGYRSSQDERQRAEAAHRESLVLRLLDGRPVESVEVSEWLGIAPTDRLVVVVAERQDPSARDALERVVRYASMHGAWADRGDVTFGIVALRTEQPARVRTALQRVPRLRAGVSQTHVLADVVDAARQATLACRSIAPGATEVATLFDHPLGVLVAGQAALAVTLAQAFLAGILDRPERERDLLLETLVAYDDTDGSVTEVAERLFCHRNTVLNRMAKISRLTGASFTSPHDLAQVALAAQVLRSEGLAAVTAPPPAR